MTSIEPAPIKDTIDFATFEKIDIRVGTIRGVDQVEDSNKLVKLTVDFGDHTRGILFDIGYADGVTPVLATPEAPVPDGCRAG